MHGFHEVLIRLSNVCVLYEGFPELAGIDICFVSNTGVVEGKIKVGKVVAELARLGSNFGTERSPLPGIGIVVVILLYGGGESKIEVSVDEVRLVVIESGVRLLIKDNCEYRDCSSGTGNGSKSVNSPCKANVAQISSRSVRSGIRRCKEGGLGGCESILNV
jgi:hypothetical protein